MDYNLEIACRLGKANLVADALSHRKANVSVEKEMGGLISMVEMLRVNVLIDESVHLGKEAVKMVEDGVVGY